LIEVDVLIQDEAGEKTSDAKFKLLRPDETTASGGGRLLESKPVVGWTDPSSSVERPRRSTLVSEIRKTRRIYDVCESLTR
jgi:hypothetical protein